MKNYKRFHPAIQDYIDIVKGAHVFNKPVPVCEEQKILIDYVIKVFEEEDLFINEDQLDKYLDLQKYFPFKLFPWETFCFALHNCVYKSNGQLRWPILFIYVGRGAGKNGYLAFEDFALLTHINGIKQYHIDIFAMAEDQAKTTFEDVWNVLEDNKVKLKNHFYWNKEEIINLKTKSKLKFRTSSPKTKDGGRPGKVDFDEYHAYETMKLVDVATTGLGKKPHPRRTIITTDGDIREGPLDKIKIRADEVLRGGMPDNGTLFFLCKLDKEDEIREKDMWPKANPSLIYLPTLQHELDLEFSDYLIDPIGNSSFATKRMNMPQGNKDVEVTSWDNIMATNQDMVDLSGFTCVAGIDYAKTTDFVAAGLLFLYKGKYYWITHTWVCKNSPHLPGIKAPIKEWEMRGLLTIIDAPEIAPSIPAEWLASQASKYNITTLGIDNYRYTLLSKALRDAGFDTDKKGANNIRLIRPSNEMYIAPTVNSLFVNHNIVYGDSPLMRWYTNNSCRVESETSGNMTYGKIEPKFRKTDGFKAFIAALCASENLPDSGEESFMSLEVYTY